MYNGVSFFCDYSTKSNRYNADICSQFHHPKGTL